MRRELVKEFMAMIVKDKICRSCAGISPVYRKDRFVKIFERELTVKEKTKMAQAGKKKTDALLAAKRYAKGRDGYASDEGIADLDLSSDENAQSEGSGEELDENGDVVMPDAGSRNQKSPARGAQGPLY